MKYLIQILVGLSLAYSTIIQADNFTFSSGFIATPYHEAAKEIERILESNSDSINIYVGESTGSVENMQRLKSGLADLAIVQQNLALDYFYNEEHHFSNFEVVLPLFPEALQIIRRGSTETAQFSEYIKQVSTGLIRHLYVGDEGSATHQFMSDLLNIFGVPTPKGFFKFGDFLTAKQAFKTAGLDSFAFISGFPSSVMLDLQAHGGFITFSDSNLNFVLSHINGFSKIIMDSLVYSNALNPIQSIGTWSLLVASENFSNKSKDLNLTHTLVESLYKEKGSSILSDNLRSNNLYMYNPESVTVEILKGSKSDFLNGLNLTDDLSDLIEGEISYWGVAFLLCIPFLFLLNRSDRTPFDLRVFWIRYKHFVFALVFVVGIYFVVAEVILLSERALSNVSGIRNGFDDVSLLEVHRWLLVFSFTGYNGVLFPQSNMGQILATLSTFLGALAAIFAIVGEFVFNLKNKKRRKGYMDFNYEGHIVICGWNDRIPSLIDKAMHAQQEHFGKFKLNIVVIAENFTEVLDADMNLQAYFDRHQLDFVAGKARDINALSKANVDKAKTVILVAEDKGISADESTLLCALSVSRYCREKSGFRGIDSIYMIAEINHEEMRDPLLNADVNEVVNVADIGENILVQSTFNHGVSTALTNMVTYNEFNEFNVLDVQEFPFLIGKKYDEALMELRKFNVLLMSIKVVLENEDGSPLIDSRIIAERICEMGLDRQIITNPINSAENSYIIKNRDQVIVLSASVDDLEKCKAA